MKRLSTAATMRAQIERLHERAEFIAGMHDGLAAGMAEANTVADPPADNDPDAGFWIRDPSSGERQWIRRSR